MWKKRKKYKFMKKLMHGKLPLLHNFMLKICLVWGTHVFEDSCKKIFTNFTNTCDWIIADILQCVHFSDFCEAVWLPVSVCIVSDASRTVPWIHILMRLKSGLQFRASDSACTHCYTNSIFLSLPNPWRNLYTSALSELAHPMESVYIYLILGQLKQF